MKKLRFLLHFILSGTMITFIGFHTVLAEETSISSIDPTHIPSKDSIPSKDTPPVDSVSTPKDSSDSTYSSSAPTDSSSKDSSSSQDVPSKDSASIPSDTSSDDSSSQDVLDKNSGSTPTDSASDDSVSSSQDVSAEDSASSPANSSSNDSVSPSQDVSAEGSTSSPTDSSSNDSVSSSQDAPDENSGSTSTESSSNDSVSSSQDVPNENSGSTSTESSSSDSVSSSQDSPSDGSASAPTVSSSNSVTYEDIPLEDNTICGLPTNNENSLESEPPSYEISDINPPSCSQALLTLPLADVSSLDILSKLPTSVSAHTTDYQYVQLPINWQIDSSSFTSGINYIKGVVDIGDYTTKLSSTGVSIPIIIYDNELQNLDTIKPNDYNNFITPVPIGESIDYLASLLSQKYNWDSTALENAWYTSGINWDTSSFDSSTVGLKEIMGTVDLPSCIHLSDDQKLSQSIYVMESDKIDLGATSFNNGEITSKWLYTLDNIDLASCWYSTDLVNWDKDTEYSYIESNQLTIPSFALDPEQDYYFYIEYEGSKSNILHITSKNGELIYKPINIDNSRDGSNYENSELPNSNPLPNDTKLPDFDPLPGNLIPDDASNQDTASDSNTADSEAVTDSSTSFTGEHLNTLIEVNPETIYFEKQGVLVNIDSEFLKSLNLLKNDIFTVVLNMVGSYGFNLQLFVNDTPIDELPEMEVEFPVDLKDRASLALTHIEEAENAIPASNYNEEFSIASYHINKAGTYILAEKQEDYEKDMDSTEVFTQNTIFPNPPDNGTSNLSQATFTQPSQFAAAKKAHSWPSYSSVAVCITAASSGLILTLRKYRRRMHHE